MTKVFADRRLEDRARKEGLNVQLLWEINGPKNTDVAKISMYIINNLLVAVHTYGAGGFNIFPAVEGITISGSIEQVIDKARTAK